MSPIEFEALKKWHERERQDRLALYAGLQAAIYTGPRMRKDKRPWEPKDFIGPQKPPVPLVQRKGEILEMLKSAAQINKERKRG